MGTSLSADPITWLRRRAVWIIAAFVLGALAVMACREYLAAESTLPSAVEALPPSPPQRWAPVTGLFDGKIHALLVEDPLGLQVVYAGTDGGVFKSCDQGRTWLASNNGLEDRLVRALRSILMTPTFSTRGHGTASCIAAMMGAVVGRIAVMDCRPWK